MGKKRLFVINTLVMTAGSLILRFSGIAFRAWVCLRIGAKGMGQYHLMMTIFMLAVTASTSGFGFAVTRTVAEKRGGRRQVRGLVACAVTFSLLAALVIWFAAPWLGPTLLGGSETILPMRLLAPGLPFMALSACLSGYFLAVRNTLLPALGSLLEQVATIGSAVALFPFMEPLGALCLGGSLGEVVSCGFTLTCYLILSCKKRLARSGCARVGELIHIAAPVLGGSFARSSLSSVENLLVPRGLQLYGGGETAALERYGIMNAMVLPIITLPSCLLISAASLLIPELAELNIRGHTRGIQRAAQRAIVLTMWFSFTVTGLIILFAPYIGSHFYNSVQAGEFLRIMAPIIPLWYLDSVVDGMLKGLDQQIYSFRYNLMDSILRVTMAALLLPRFGLRGYFFLLFASEIFNASLSINRLLKVTQLEADIIWWLLAPAAAAGTVYYLLQLGILVWL